MAKFVYELYSIVEPCPGYGGRSDFGIFLDRQVAENNQKRIWEDYFRKNHGEPNIWNGSVHSIDDHIVYSGWNEKNMKKVDLVLAERILVDG